MSDKQTELPLVGEAPPVKELVPMFIHEMNGVATPCVSARVLHATLDVGRDFSTWVRGRIRTTAGIVEGEDFKQIVPPRAGNPKGRGGDRKSIDWILTADVAKHFAMMENTPAGHAIRRYFIECEKRLHAADYSMLAPPPAATPEPAQLPAPAAAPALIGPVLHGTKGIVRKQLEPLYTLLGQLGEQLHAIEVGAGRFEARIERHNNGTVRERHKTVVTQLQEISRAIAQPQSPGRRVAAAMEEMPDINRIYELAGVTAKIPRQGLLTNAAKRSLDSFFKREGYAMGQVTVGGRNIDTFHIAGVTVWLDKGGREMIAAHIARYSTA